MQESGGDLYVIPDEAVGLLGADELDPRLFDVTGLIEMGYDDAGTGTVPLIADLHPGPDPRRRRPRRPRRAAGLVRELPAHRRRGAERAPKPQARTFWTSVAPAAAT